jgi:tripartite-type tricarboxylate transporter receptor subunit TctC
MRRIILGLIAAAWLSGAAAAQEWPGKPVRIIIPYPPGGSTDIMARPYAQALSQKFGQQFVLEHKPGATGAIGMEATAKSAPDGYTFTITAAASAVAMPAVRKTLPYKWLEDFEPIGRISTLGLVVAIHPSVKAQTLAEFVGLSKQEPGKLSYGVAGVGATSHFAGEHLKQLTGADMTSIPYRGSVEVQNDFLGGHVQVMIDGQILPHVKAGKGRLLAYIDEERHPEFPDVPTIKEVLPNWQIYVWFGALAPKGTPRPIVDKLSAALNEIGRQPEIKAMLAPVAQRPVADTPEGFAATMRRDHALYSRLAKELDLKTD